MSHGTGSGYAVVSPAELNRRAVDGARLRCSALRARLGETQLAAPLNGSVSAWERYEATLTEALDAAALALVAEAVQIRTDELTLLLPQPREAAPADTSDADDIGAALERARPLLARIEDDAARTGLVATARKAWTIRSEDPAAARGLLQVVRAEAQRELRAQDARTQLTARAMRLADLHADVPGAEPLRATLEERAAAIDEETLVRVEQELLALRAKANAEADRRFVVEQTADALRALGYTVGETFVPQALGGRAVVGAPEGPSYGLELDFHPKRPRLVTEVVAFTPSNAHDREAEEAACRHLDLLAEQLADSVVLTREQTLEPGAAPVVRVAGSASTGSANTMAVRAR